MTRLFKTKPLSWKASNFNYNRRIKAMLSTIKKLNQQGLRAKTKLQSLKKTLKQESLDYSSYKLKKNRLIDKSLQNQHLKRHRIPKNSKCSETNWISIKEHTRLNSKDARKCKKSCLNKIQSSKMSAQSQTKCKKLSEEKMRQRLKGKTWKRGMPLAEALTLILKSKSATQRCKTPSSKCKSKTQKRKFSSQRISYLGLTESSSLKTWKTNQISPT